MGTCFCRYMDAHKMARAKQLDENACKTQPDSLIETWKPAFESSLREEDDKIGNASFCIKGHWQNINVEGWNPD